MHTIIDSLNEKINELLILLFMALFFKDIDLINLYILNIIRCKCLDI